MTIHIEVNNQQKMRYLVELLKSMDFVDQIRVDEENKAVVAPVTDEPLSSKYWGAWKNNPLSMEKIDFEIRKMRDEWDRDIY
jgi:hypothetical protein